MSRMSNDETGDSESKLARGTLECSATEYYSCFSEIMTTDHESSPSASSSSMVEQTGDKNSPNELSGDEPSRDELTGDKPPPDELIGDKPSPNKVDGGEPSANELTGDKPSTKKEVVNECPSSYKEEPGDDPHSISEEQTEDQLCLSVEEQSRTETMPGFMPLDGKNEVNKSPTPAASDDTEIPHNTASSMPPQGIRSIHTFEVKLVCGLLGLGLTVGNDDFNDVVVQKIGIFTPAAAQGQLRYIKHTVYMYTMYTMSLLYHAYTLQGW